jgi:hypothetical protein
MAGENATLQAAAAVGNSVAVNSIVCQIVDPGVGRYQISGSARHTLEDGCKLIIGAANVLPRIPQGPNNVGEFGPIIFDIIASSTDIQIQLATATGATETASGYLVARRLDNESE